MSTIERAAELLGPIERPNPTAFAQDTPDSINRSASAGAEGAGASETRDLAAQLNAIERTLSRSTEGSGFPQALELAAQIKARSIAAESKPRIRSVPPANTTTRTLNIDRDQLRRQCMITPDGERTQIAESFRRIKRQILANVGKFRPGAPANLVLLTSALPGEGKTFCAINLAISIALEMDRTVLLVDADVAKPSIPQALGLNPEQGLLDVLLYSKMALADVLCKTDIGKLTILPAGKAHHHSTELLASDAMSGLLREMAERYPDRIIIFDSPPLLAASEASVLASQMGQVVLVVEAGKTSEAMVKAALGRIESSNITTGLLLNKVEVAAGDYYRDYG